jgi:predicted alpha/beta hydrolase family esterase
MLDDPDGHAASELARQLLLHAPPGSDTRHWQEWLEAAATVIADDERFARLVLGALTITAAAALYSLDQWSPGVRAAVLRLDEAPS